MRERLQGTTPTMRNIEGSLPQMRERRPKGLLLSKRRRITPAYAGKNALIYFLWYRTRDARAIRRVTPRS